MARTVNRTGARRTQTTKTPAAEERITLTSSEYASSRSGTYLDHGLDDGEYRYVWANSMWQPDVVDKRTDGYVFVKMDDVRERLAELGTDTYLFSEDESGNVRLNELVLMRCSRDGYNRRMAEAMYEHSSNLSDAGTADFNARFEDFLTNNNGTSGKFRVSVDKDHGSKVTHKLNEEE